MTWGAYGDADLHQRYMEVNRFQHHRRLCDCGCKTKATHVGMCNGVALTRGCELSIRRWVRDGFKRLKR
ncbi:hypothetical protein D3C78_157500 [compost metagenome]